MIKSYHPTPWQDLISRPLAPVSSMAGRDDTTRPRRQGVNENTIGDLQHWSQRATLNFTPGPLGMNLSPQGWNLSPRGNVHPIVHPQGWTLSTIKKNGGYNREFHPQGITSPPGYKIHPWWTNPPLGPKFAPRGEVKNGPLGDSDLLGNWDPCRHSSPAASAGNWMNLTVWTGLRSRGLSGPEANVENPFSGRNGLNNGFLSYYTAFAANPLI
jgi:hypothetical protein